MKKWFCAISALAALMLFGGNAMADDDPVLCSVAINYKGMDLGGRDDGADDASAIHEAKEEACDRACRKGGDACEHDCMAHAVVKKHDCKPNPKANKNRDKWEYDCRVAIRYEGNEYHAFDDDRDVDKAVRDAVEDACEIACQGQGKPKKCEHRCRVNAEIIGRECIDRNDKIPVHEGKLPPRPENFHPVVAKPVPARSVGSPTPVASPGKPSPVVSPVANKPNKEAKKEDKKDDKGQKKDAKGPKKDDKKPKKDDKKDKKGKK